MDYFGCQSWKFAIKTVTSWGQRDFWESTWKFLCFHEITSESFWEIYINFINPIFLNFERLVLQTEKFITVLVKIFELLGSIAELVLCAPKWTMDLFLSFFFKILSKTHNFIPSQTVQFLSHPTHFVNSERLRTSVLDKTMFSQRY